MSRVALITGASGGLGGIIASELNSAGIHTILHYHRNAPSIKRITTTLKGTWETLSGDLGDPGVVRTIAERISKDPGRLDLLVHAAGINRDLLLVKHRIDDWEEVIRVNLKSAFLLAKELSPLIISSGGGHIIFISSRSGIKGRKGQAAYSAAKAGLIGLTKSLARELAPDGVHLNVVIPGYLPTGMGAVSGKAALTATRESLTGSLSDPANTASFINFLSSTKGITGQVFCLENRI